MAFVEEKLQVEEEVRRATWNLQPVMRSRSPSLLRQGMPMRTGSPPRKPNPWQAKDKMRQVRSVATEDLVVAVKPSSPPSSDNEEPPKKSHKAPRTPRSASRDKGGMSRPVSRERKDSPPRLIVPPQMAMHAPAKVWEERGRTPVRRTSNVFPPCPHCWNAKGWKVTSHSEHECFHNPANRMSGKGGRPQLPQPPIGSKGKGAQGHELVHMMGGRGKGKGKGKGQ